MKPNKDKKDNTFLYIISTLVFVVLGIILTSVINVTKPSDARIRASATGGIEATAVVTAVDSGTNSITVKNLVFASSPTTNLGNWVITPPSSFVLSSIITGTTITIKIDSTHFDIKAHTLTAKEIKKK